MIFKNARGFDVQVCPDYAKMEFISIILQHVKAQPSAIPTSLKKHLSPTSPIPQILWFFFP